MVFNCTQALVKCCMTDMAAELEEDLTGLLEALARIFDPGTFFHQHNKNQDNIGSKVRPFMRNASPLLPVPPNVKCRFWFLRPYLPEIEVE